jgi:putative ABC transport system permease protein
MRISNLLQRNLIYYWRSNLAVVLGVATAVAVLSGALLVGDSVRGSLRDIFAQRLGKTDQIIASTTSFREKLADDLQSNGEFDVAFTKACPLIVTTGLVTHEASGRRASAVQVYGVDERFWKFHDRADVKPPTERELLLSPDLARELGSEPGQTILLRIEKPSAIPAGSLHGRKDDLGRTVRLTFRDTLAASELGEFSLTPSQGPVRAAFVSLARLQKDTDQSGRINTILLRDKLPPTNESLDSDLARVSKLLRDTFTFDDLGLKLRVLDEQRGVAIESASAIISDNLYTNAQTAAGNAGVTLQPVLSYLANSIRAGQREVPYSLVTALDVNAFEKLTRATQPAGSDRAAEQKLENAGSAGDRSPPAPIVLNDWAAGDLEARTGDIITLEYYLWKDEGALSTQTATFQLAAIVPMKDEAADRDYVPDYPGITTTQNIADWDPPFPVDLKRVRPRDEDYWHKYRTTPKAFIPLEAGQHLWQSRYGKLTSVRVLGALEAGSTARLDLFSRTLRDNLDPTQNGFSINPVRIQGLEASRGATDFGEYFVYFSFFLVAGALLLASLFFKLGIEQRLREIGTLRALGFPIATVRSIFIREGLVLATAGSLLGVLGAVAYGQFIIYALRTWWVGAVGTTALSLHVSVLSLLSGAAGGVIVALLCVVWALRALKRSSPRSLLTGSIDAVTESDPSRRRMVTTRTMSVVLGVLGALLLMCAAANWIGATPGFFAGGTALLGALLCWQHAWLRRKRPHLLRGHGWWSVSRLGYRNASYRPGRSVLCIALIASAAFIIVAVDAFKRDSRDAGLEKHGGAGGFPLLAESLLPLYHDPNTAEGREALNLAPRSGFDPDRVTFKRFRVRQGDDASCLNLYQPRNPRILAPGDDFVQSGRFSFQESLAQTKEEKQNPWLLLNRQLPDGAIPAIADANSMTYVLHRKLGDEIVVNASNGEPARLKLVAALSDSIFQSELLISEPNFLRLFPEQGGYSFFLLEVAPEAASVASGVLEDELADFGFDAVPTSERLASFHRVENTYLSTFQTLGGLGLLLGTLGLATVLLRNVLERRRELALLRAIGYNSAHFALMVLAENAFLVCCGLATGALCALIAIGPAFVSRGGHLPAVSLWLLLSVLVTGLAASLAATWAALRTPLLPALRAE